MSESVERPPRLRPLEPGEAPDVKDIFDFYLRERGKIPNMFRTVARRSDHLRTMIDHMQAVMRKGTVPPLLKEYISVRVSALNDCHY